MLVITISYTLNIYFINDCGEKKLLITKQLKFNFYKISYITVYTSDLMFPKK